MSRISARCWLLAARRLLAQDARQIVEESQRRGRTNSQRYEGSLEVIGANNKVSKKRWTFERLGSYGESKAIIRFTAPAEVKGVALLVVNHPDRSSDQWMWTPAIGRDRRIALQDRSTRFFGTDFSFEDLEERDVNQYEYKLTGEEAIDGAAVLAHRGAPAPRQDSQYTSLAHLDPQGQLCRPCSTRTSSRTSWSAGCTQTDIAKVQGIWTARTLEMTDLGATAGPC